MAQNITLMGASYSAVPAVDLPKTGGGTARFTDATVTTATEADVAQGKVFIKADGSQATGTASSGGGTPQKFVMRPDAELIHKWTADELLVEDLGITLPAYATSAKVIKTGAALSPTITVDYTHYDYYVTMRGLAIPQYNTETKVKGRCDYGASAYLYELIVIPANEIQTLDGTKKYTSRNAVVTANGSVGREMYWTSATAIGLANNVTYGAYVTGQAPAISGTTLTVKAPNYGIRGHTSQMTSTAWGQMTDIREQYVIEVWRAPKDDIEGWGLTTSVRDVVEAVQNGGDLFEVISAITLSGMTSGAYYVGTEMPTPESIYEQRIIDSAKKGATIYVALEDSYEMTVNNGTISTAGVGRVEEYGVYSFVMPGADANIYIELD